MRFTHAELIRFALPLVSPFRTANGVSDVRLGFLVRVIGPDGDGWGECVAEAEPTYTSEYSEGAYAAVRELLLPRLARGTGKAFDEVDGHRMAKAALRAAVLDAECRKVGMSLAQRLGATRRVLPVGVVVGLQATPSATVDSVKQCVEQGYGRVKLKIARGSDVEYVAAVRAAFPDLDLQVDANRSYSLDDADDVATLSDLDEFDLQLIEQPLGADDLEGHARLGAQLRTAICLDESITSVDAARRAIEMDACRAICLKPAMVGGIAQAMAVHDLCFDAEIDLKCGGMLETGVGRAANLALAALPGFTLMGDLSASDRYFTEDLTEPFVLEDGCLRVPSGPGIGVEPLPEVLERYTVSRETITLSDTLAG